MSRLFATSIFGSKSEDGERSPSPNTYAQEMERRDSINEFAQWHQAVRMVARLPGGVPNEFRKKLWTTLADRYIDSVDQNWPETSKKCFSEKNTPEDEALGQQIIRDVHRTGLSLFSGDNNELNQALLKKVLLAYTRWNRHVGYCQGFNMLAALILEVLEWDIDNALKTMIYLIEGILPESYYANNLRGLIIDMAVFWEIVRRRLPELAAHLEKLQKAEPKRQADEPPLVNIFAMQWFLTLFSNCLPRAQVLRIWDALFLEGNEILMRASLAVLDHLSERIISVKSSDEYFSIMGVLTREMMEFGIGDTNELIKIIYNLSEFPLPELGELRVELSSTMRPAMPQLVRRANYRLMNMENWSFSSFLSSS